MYCKSSYILFFILFYTAFLVGQEVQLQDTLIQKRERLETQNMASNSGRIDTLPSDSGLDTMALLATPYDTLPPGSTPKPPSPKPQKAKIAKSSLEQEIIYGAVDSQWYDNKNKLMYLYGDAYVKYEKKELEADLIILDMENKIAEAKISEVKNSSKKPVFKDGEKEYQYRGLRYNFEKEKGIVTDAITQEGEFIVHAEKTKYVGAKSNEYSDGDVIYNANSLITTCNHENPHFGFKTKKLKVIPDKVAISGPANLQIAGVPTPFWIPFGFFPLTQGTRSGLIFPSGYEFYSKNLGFGLSGIGWYFPINDYIHTTITGNAYTKGTHGLDWNTSYAKKYKYRGSVNLSYDNFKTPSSDGLTRDSNKGFNISINHNQDSKAHPYVSLGGSISIVGNNNINRVNNDAVSVLTSTYRSNFNYSHTMPSTPFSFRMGMNHDQNTNTGKMNFTLPDISLQMNTIYPLANKSGVGKEKWFEKLALGYSSKFKTYTTTSDSTLFTQETLDNVRSGMNHKATLSLSARVFKYFNIVPNANYEETWVANTIENFTQKVPEYEYVVEDTLLGVRADTLTSFVDSLITEINSDFAAYRKFSAGVSINTQIFGTKTFKRGPIRGIRHLMKPSVGFRYAPDNSGLLDTLTYFDGTQRILSYSKFDQGPFGSPGLSKLQSQLTYGLNNVLEVKYWSKKDSVDKKFKVFDNVTINGNYNFASDSIHWSTHTISSTTRLFNGITNLTSRWTFDPYMESNGRRIATTVWQDQRKVARLEAGSISLSNRISFKKLRERIEKQRENRAAGEAYKEVDINLADGTDYISEEEKQKELDDQALNAEHDDHEHHDQDHDHGFGHAEDDKEERKMRSLFDIMDKLSLRHELTYKLINDDGEMRSGVSTHTLSISGSFDLTDNWSVNIGNLGYDFKGKGLSYTAVSFKRKIHCWDMAISWFPNRANTYTFAIGVSSGTLSFLKYNYGQNSTDAFFGGL